MIKQRGKTDDDEPAEQIVVAHHGAEGVAASDGPAAVAERDTEIGAQPIGIVRGERTVAVIGAEAGGEVVSLAAKPSVLIIAGRGRKPRTRHRHV